MMDTRLYHLDLIRLAAFILLICCHTCDPFNAAATYGAGIATYEYTLWGSIYGALAASWSAVYGLRRLLGRRAGRVLLG